MYIIKYNRASKNINVDTQLLMWKDANDTGERNHYRIIVMCFLSNVSKNNLIVKYNEYIQSIENKLI